MADAGIVRNRAKILAAIQNAGVFLAIQEEFGSFDRYLWGFTAGKVVLNTDDVFHTQHGAVRPNLQGSETAGDEVRGHDHHLLVPAGGGGGE